MFFPGCYAWLGDLVTTEYSNERCTVIEHVPETGRWAIELWDPRFNGKRILVREEKLVFDWFARPSRDLDSLPSHLQAAKIGVASSGLFCKKDLLIGDVVFEEDPLLVVAKRNSDGFDSRWNLYCRLENMRGVADPAVQGFHELWDGGIDFVKNRTSRAQSIFKRILAAGGRSFSEIENMLSSSSTQDFVNQEVSRIASVLARWDANGHAFVHGHNRHALCRHVSKMQHSCDPNCSILVNSTTGRFRVTANRKIHAGDELTKKKKRCIECLCERCVPVNGRPQGAPLPCKGVATQREHGMVGVPAQWRSNAPFGQLDEVARGFLQTSSSQFILRSTLACPLAEIMWRRRVPEIVSCLRRCLSIAGVDDGTLTCCPVCGRSFLTSTEETLQQHLQSIFHFQGLCRSMYFVGIDRVKNESESHLQRISGTGGRICWFNHISGESGIYESQSPRFKPYKLLDVDPGGSAGSACSSGYSCCGSHESCIYHLVCRRTLHDAGMIVKFLCEFARPEKSHLFSAAMREYDARRVNLHLVLREARKKQLAYEIADVPVPHNAQESILIDANGPQHWYLRQSGQGKNTLFNPETRMILACLSDYDFRRASLEKAMKEASRQQQRYVSFECPHVEKDACIVDECMCLFSNMEIANRFQHTNSLHHGTSVAIASVVDYDTRRVALHDFLQRARAKEFQFEQADKLIAYAEQIVDTPIMYMTSYSLQFDTPSDMIQAVLSLIKDNTQKRARDMKFAEEVANKRAKIAEDKVAELQHTISELRCKIGGGPQALTQNAQWQYEDHGKWHSFALDANEQMKKAYAGYLDRGSATIIISSGGVQRMIDFTGMFQRNECTGTSRKIRLFVDVPPGWTTTNDDLLRQTLSTRPMYIKVEDSRVIAAVHKLLSQACHSDKKSHYTSPCFAVHEVSIQSLFRIENLALWHKYAMRMQHLRDEHARCHAHVVPVHPRLGCNREEFASVLRMLDTDVVLNSDVNEQILFHGTTYDNADSIVRSGFDARVTYRGLYGLGVYFASESCKSHQYTCAKLNARHSYGCTCEEERTMIIARVVLGESHYTNHTMENERRPPECGRRLYDSIIANPGKMLGHPNKGGQSHQEFVIFENTQAYPSFVVQYKVNK